MLSGRSPSFCSPTNLHGHPGIGILHGIDFMVSGSFIGFRRFEHGTQTGGLSLGAVGFTSYSETASVLALVTCEASPPRTWT